MRTQRSTGGQVSLLSYEDRDEVTGSLSICASCLPCSHKGFC